MEMMKKEIQIERTKEAMIQRMKELNAIDKENIAMKKNAIIIFKNAQKVGNKIFVELPLEYMKVDHQMYQRPVQSHVYTLAKNWKDDRCNPILVNYRGDGYFYIIDGQHRYEALKIKGMDSVVCEILVGLTVKQEADLFVEQNVGTKKLSPYDTFKANVCRGEIIDSIINKLCCEYGINVRKVNSSKNLKCLTAVRRILKNEKNGFGNNYERGTDIIRWIFSVIEKSGWENDSKGYSQATVMALKSIYTKYETELTKITGYLVNFMKRYTYAQILTMSNQRHPDLGACPDKKLALGLLDIVENDFDEDIMHTQSISFVA